MVISPSPLDPTSIVTAIIEKAVEIAVNGREKTVEAKKETLNELLSHSNLWFNELTEPLVQSLGDMLAEALVSPPGETPEPKDYILLARETNDKLASALHKVKLEAISAGALVNAGDDLANVINQIASSRGASSPEMTNLQYATVNFLEAGDFLKVAASRFGTWTPEPGVISDKAANQRQLAQELVAEWAKFRDARKSLVSEINRQLGQLR
jgi:hypothetical protein